MIWKINKDYIGLGGTPPVQNPGVWDALDSLRGKGALIADEIILILATAVAGTDYPNYADMPETSFNCASVKQVCLTVPNVMTSL